MADTAIAITAGSGTNVDTRTEGTNGNHRQVIVVGDPATNAGVAPVDATNGLKVDIAANGVIGEVQATPTANTVLARLKDIDDAISSAASTALPAGTNAIGSVNTNFTYETVAASQTGQVLGASGATGDYLAGILVIPASTSPGNVIILDNATSITIFAGGASSVSNLVPFFIPIGAKSASGAWSVTTGANVSCIGVGIFS